MTTLLNPYLAFEREAREAMNFYHGVFGGDLVATTFAEGGMLHEPDEAERIMHSQLTTAEGHTIMASDTPAGAEAPARGQQVSISGDDAHQLTRYWEGLAEGARIVEPLARAPWGDTFGMLVDRWGVTWMVSIAAPTGPADAAGPPAG
ncbi:VOC family protein [Agrococcus baldri]|uniref:VOC family protein n=1 Tax=Agrococcus baldri TaxID=153730 RepID=A0AA87USD8_9MICO|nr:VOC family protein [Agrococcus baldri]GEK80295.1 VOC family protein [Agrococcus baldri]